MKKIFISLLLFLYFLSANCRDRDFNKISYGYITNHSSQGAGAFRYGVITDSDHKSHIVVSKKIWEGEFVEVEILKK